MSVNGPAIKINVIMQITAVTVILLWLIVLLVLTVTRSLFAVHLKMPVPLEYLYFLLLVDMRV